MTLRKRDPEKKRERETPRVIETETLKDYEKGDS